MKGTYLGEFEELVLLSVAVLNGQAYGVSITDVIEEQANRVVTISTVHNVLYRLEKKGFVESYLGGATKERGGRKKRLFKGNIIIIYCYWACYMEHKQWYVIRYKYENSF